MESDWGCFNDYQSNSSVSELDDDYKMTREKSLDEIIPFNHQSANNQIEESQQVEQPSNQPIPSYYGRSEEYWSYITEIDLHPDFTLNLTKEEFDQIQSQKVKSSNTNRKIASVKKGKRKAYREGEEYRKISKDPNYNTKYDNTYLFKDLKVKTHAKVKMLGDMFNKDFEKQIKSGKIGLTKFPRKANRKVNISYMFFQNLYEDKKTKPIIETWLKARASELNSNSH